MDIAMLSITLNQAQIQQDVSMSVMKKAMGSAEQQGHALQKLMNTADISALQHAAQTHLGGNFDLKL